jgi:murein L,D-transpeptidase YcbB/YkuD
MPTAIRIALLVLASTRPVAAWSSDVPRPEVAAAVQALLETGRDPVLSRPDLAPDLPSLKALYAAEPGGLFWFDGTSPRPAVAGCLDTLARTAEIGLPPPEYDAGPLASRWGALGSGPPPSTAELAQIDVGLSAAVMRLLRHVRMGRVDPRTVGFDMDPSPKRLNLPAVLRSVRDGGSCAGAVAAAEPKFAFYTRAVKALADHRALASRGEPPPVPALPPGRRKIEPGQPWEGVPALEARLRLLGDLPADAAAPGLAPDGTPLYADPVVDAVKRFQDRHVLDPDGVIGKATVEAVNTPLATRVRQIELALERMRWIPAPPDQPAIVVNVPLFELWALEPGKPTNLFRMRVVTGRSGPHATPIFIDKLEYVVFRPYWNPPPSIIRNEILPHARRDPAYLDREALEIVASGEDDAPALPATPENLALVESGRLHLRQRPGPKNSLGLAKFIFPNANNVYMHGTPAMKLFARTRRDFSHGCIRLEDPARLAEWVLRDNPEWNRPRIEQSMKGERPVHVNLRTPVTVIIFYDTVLVDEEGVVHFAGDYYRHDARLEQALRSAR